MIWNTLAKMLRVPERAAEDALKSERAARMTLTRRGLLLAGASAMPSLALGNLFGDINRNLPLLLRGWHQAETFDSAVVFSEGASAVGCTFLGGIDRMMGSNTLTGSTITQIGRAIQLDDGSKPGFISFCNFLTDRQAPS